MSKITKNIPVYVVTFAKTFDKNRKQIETNDIEIIEELKKLSLSAHGYVKSPINSKTFNLVTINSKELEYITLFIYLINNQTFENIKSKYNSKITIIERDKKVCKKTKKN